MMKILVVAIALSLAPVASARPLPVCKNLIKKCEKAGGVGCAEKFPIGDMCREAKPRAKRATK